MLAIGIYFEQCFTTSIGIDSKNPQKCALALAKHNGNGYPDEILLVENDIVIGHFHSNCGAGDEEGLVRKNEFDRRII